MVGLSLILEAAIRSLRVRVEADRLVVRGPRAEEGLARELIAAKGDLVEALQRHPELADLDPFTASVMQAFGGVPVLSGEGWPEGSWSLVVGISSDPDLEGTGPCRSCGSARRWRLESGGPWVCARYHPSLVPADQVETVDVPEAAP